MKYAMYEEWTGLSNGGVINKNVIAMATITYYQNYAEAKQFIIHLSTNTNPIYQFTIEWKDLLNTKWIFSSAGNSLKFNLTEKCGIDFHQRIDCKLILVSVKNYELKGST